MMPHVSVIVPTYQRASLLGETIGSLLSQTLTDLEIIVADDGSMDETPDIIAGFRDPRVRYLGSEHLGMPRIWNRALSWVRGRYVMTCHDHDRYDRTLLAELSALLDQNPTAAYGHCGIIGLDANGSREVGRYILDCPELMCGMSFLTSVLLPGLDSKVSAMTMFRRTAIDGRGLDPAFGESADVELWMRLACRGDVAYTSSPLIAVTKRDQSSVMYHRGARLAAQVLAAKRKYLRMIQNPARRKRIEAGWRRAIDKLAFSEWLKVAESRLPEEEDFLLEFVRREGSAPTARVVRVLRWLPHPISLEMLRLARRLSRRLSRR